MVEMLSTDLSPPLTLVNNEYMSTPCLSEALCISQTGSWFVEVLSLLLSISPSWNEISKHVRFLFVSTVPGSLGLFCGILASFRDISSAIEWHQRDREVFQHNSASSCHKCWMSVSSLCIFSTSAYCPYRHIWCILLHLCKKNKKRSSK